jgi:hypothetical protein
MDATDFAISAKVPGVKSSVRLFENSEAFASALI